MRIYGQRDFRGNLCSGPWDTGHRTLKLMNAPIQNIWGWLKYHFSNDMPNTIKDVQKSIKTHWKMFLPELLTHTLKAHQIG